MEDGDVSSDTYMSDCLMTLSRLVQASGLQGFGNCRGCS